MVSGQVERPPPIKLKEHVMYEHLLVPVDGSELSLKAEEHAIGLAKMLGARITALTVEPPLPVLVVEQSAVAYDVATFQEHEKRCEAHARELLEAFAAKAKAAGVHFDGQFVITDDVQQAIVDTAQKHGCDLIVMATHGRHGFDALIHGSLTKSVLSHCQIPLLILH
jgi:nucleotide-binding universal stress UspA family protein